MVDATDGSPFDIVSYSQFKYGSRRPGITYGQEVALAFIRSFPDLATSTTRIVVVGPSYKYAPTPAQTIAGSFSSALSTWRTKRGLEPTVPMHIIRSRVGTDTYAMAGLADRLLLNAQSGHHVDGSLIAGAIVIVIDDVKLTGQTEARMHARLMPHEPDTICYMHLAVVEDAPPEIEDVMNRASIPSLDRIDATIMAGDFLLSSRVLDFILKSPDTEELYRFLYDQDDRFLEELFTAMMSSTLEFYGRYPDGVCTLERVIRERKLSIMAFTIPTREETDALDPMQYLTEDERTTVLDYDANAASRQRGPEFWLPEVATFGRLLSIRGRILEIGCGNGAEGESLTDAGFSYVGTDVSAGYLAQARAQRPGLDTRWMSAYKLHFPDNSFDGTWSGNTLYHLPKDRLGEALAEIHRVTRGGGLVFVSLPVGEGEGMWTKQSFGYDSTRLWSKYEPLEAFGVFQAQGFDLLELDYKESNGSGKADEVIRWMLLYFSVVK
ncbi:MAG TPA: phosphoribosyltransferase family protein [Magnetospirillaceae bacterium]|nr:phosphoribosyltransferase family protein [Magnetospirillaceae bacterium]